MIWIILCLVALFIYISIVLIWALSEIDRLKEWLKDLQFPGRRIDPGFYGLSPTGEPPAQKRKPKT